VLIDGAATSVTIRETGVDRKCELCEIFGNRLQPGGKVVVL